MNNPKYFYELFLKTRYLDDFTAGDLKSYAELIMLSDIDFKKVPFSKSVQKKVMGRFLTVTEERIDKVILHSDLFSRMALSFVERELNPPSEFDQTSKWPFLPMNQKALLLKHLVALKQDYNNTQLLSDILKQGLDSEMIPERFFKTPVNEVQEFIKNYDPSYEPSLQLSIEV